MSSNPSEIQAWLEAETAKVQQNEYERREAVKADAPGSVLSEYAAPTERILVLRTDALAPTDTQAAIAEVCDELKQKLLAKNIQYGDSALNPVRIFSKASVKEQLLVRIDDKVSRLARGDDSLEPDEEIIGDLAGYLILLLVHERINE